MTNNFYLKCFCSVWLGLGKLGAVSALINTNITGDALLHTLKVVKAKAVLFTDDTEKGTLKKLSPSLLFFLGFFLFSPV